MKKFLFVLIFILSITNSLFCNNIIHLPKSFCYSSINYPLTDDNLIDTRTMPYVNTDSLINFEKELNKENDNLKKQVSSIQNKLSSNKSKVKK